MLLEGAVQTQQPLCISRLPAAVTSTNLPRPPSLPLPMAPVKPCLPRSPPPVLQIDLQFICELAAMVPVVPVLAKADTMTSEELKASCSAQLLLHALLSGRPIGPGQVGA